MLQLPVLVLVSVMSSEAYSVCLATMPRRPSNSQILYTQLNLTTDTVDQLFMCDFGYTADSGEGIFLHSKCQSGVWAPDHTVDCKARMKCNGLWFERKFDMAQRKSVCYLLKRAKTWEHSRRWCWALDSDLLTIADRDELKWLKENIPNSRSDLSAVYGPITSAAGYVWLDLSRSEDGKWHWLDEGTTLNFTWWASGVDLNDGFTHFAYADVTDNWMWYPSTNENEDNEGYMYSMCKREVDDSLTKSFPSLLSRLVLVKEGSPLVVEIPGLRNALTRYLMYEWGPIFLQALYPRLSSTNYRKLINQVIAGNEETLEKFVNISSIHDYRLIKQSADTPRQSLLLYPCTIKEKVAGSCGFTLYVNRAGVDDVSLFIKVSEAMNYRFSSMYRLEMPLIGFDEQIIILNVGSDGMSDWSPWLDCKCNEKTMKMETMRFRLCANTIDREKFTKECDSLNGMSHQSQIKLCHAIGSCSDLVYRWSPWTKCSVECGMGFHTRQRLCDPYTMPCLEADRVILENSSCEVVCKFGAVANIDIEEWIKNDPQLAQELGWNIGHMDSDNSVTGFSSTMSMVLLCFISILSFNTDISLG